MEDWNGKLIEAAENGDIEAVTLSLQNGAAIDYQDVSIRIHSIIDDCPGRTPGVNSITPGPRVSKDITDAKGRTALLFAVLEEHLVVIQLLLDSGCKPDIADKDGHTALHLAAKNGNLPITRCLITHISPSVQTHEGETPYDLAATFKRGQYQEVMEYLQVYMVLNYKCLH
ncbi:unnamed protein product [Mytilus edulis]|uniref:Uncharacterized protein n=1 Tax=Mytilus edulis TaxID=6550 RepID=A0A8S3QU68_MYTED|nr:unnamed protein product [Mytilus edulis]